MASFPLQSFIFIGRSGCGKGTQAHKLSDYIKTLDAEREVFYVQTGAIFREFIKGETHTSRLCREVYDAGGLQPEFLSIYMWSRYLIENFKGTEHLIIDGTPRKYHEAGTLDSIFTFYHRFRPYVIFLNVSESWARSRLTERQRIDDKPNGIEMRLSWYAREVEPAVSHYRTSPACHFLDIDGERPVDIIFEDIKQRLVLTP